MSTIGQRYLVTATKVANRDEMDVPLLSCPLPSMGPHEEGILYHDNSHGITILRDVGYRDLWGYSKSQEESLSGKIPEDQM